MDIVVNDTVIREVEVLREAQYHPAQDAADAFHQAARWLAIRTLLVQRARALGIAAAEDEEAPIAELLEREVDVPEPDRETCRRYYDNNPQKYRSADLAEAAHILIAAHPDDASARERAVGQAERLIVQLTEAPSRFAELAGAHSACTSKDDGGRLGQLARGDTVPEFETFLFNLEDGQLCPVPVKTRYGVHVLRVDKRLPGRQLPFDAVADRIAEDLRSRAWRRAFSQYVRLLAGAATISGVDLEGADTPLVQ